MGDISRRFFPRRPDNPIDRARWAMDPERGPRMMSLPIYNPATAGITAAMLYARALYRANRKLIDKI